MSNPRLRLILRLIIPLLSGSTLALFALGLVQAAPRPSSTTKSLSTNYTLVNLGSQAANVSVSYLKTDGTTWAASAGNTVFTMTANGGQKIIAQYFDSQMTSGQGSAIVSSDQPLAAVVQILARNQTPTSGAYSGFTAGSNTFYVPLVARLGNNSTNSQIMIQNTSNAVVTATVQLLPGSGFSGSYTKNIPNLAIGATYYYDLADETNLISTPWFGSAVVSASGGGTLAVTSNLFSGPDTLQTYNGFPSTGVSTTWFAPLFTSRLANGLSTPLTFQNLSGGTMAIGSATLNCTKDPVSPSPSTLTITNTTSVPNNTSYFFNPVVDTTNFPTGWFGSCVLTTTGNSVAFAQMRVVGGGNADAYQMLRGSGTDKKGLVPLVAKRLANGFATAVTVQNLSNSVTANVVMTYTPSSDYILGGGSATVLTTSTTIAPQASLVLNQRLASFMVGSTPMPDGWYGTFSVSSSQAVGGFVQLTNINNVAGDTLMAHNIFTQP